MAITEYNAELELDARAVLGEGPIWDSAQNVLWWVDIERGLLHRYDPAKKKDDHFDIAQRVGTVVPRQQGGVMLALEHGFAAYDPATGQLEMIGDPEEHLPGNRFNDGKCDPAGRFWAGTMDMSSERRPDAALYSLGVDRTITKHIDGVRVSNGIVWTSDAETMYYTDSRTQRVDAFEYNIDTGKIDNRRTVVDIPADMGSPDGTAIDVDDNIWVALYRGWSVVQYNPKNGERLAQIELPVANVTACAFGGEKFDRLFITTARYGLSDEELQDQPHAGSLFVAEVEARGVPAISYRG